MSSTKLLAILLPIAIFLMESCKKDDDSDNNVSQETFDCPFLKVGHEWTYDYEDFTSYGEWKTKIVSMSNGEYMVTLSKDSVVFLTQYWYTDGAFLASYDQGESRSDGSKIFKCDASVGDQWSVPSSSTPGGTVFYKVVAVDEPVTTTYGSFLCTKIEVTFSYAFNTQYNYWSNTDGLVFQDGLLLSLDLTDKNF